MSVEKEIKNMKKLRKVLLLVLSVCLLMCNTLTANAASATPNEELCDSIVATYEDVVFVPIKSNAPIRALFLLRQEEVKKQEKNNGH